MLHAIRTLWTLAAIGALVAIAHLGFYGTEMGARLAVHDMLGRNFGQTWDKWVDYSITRSEGHYEVIVRPLPGMSSDESPSDWTSRAQEWWNSPTPASDSCSLSVQNGQVWWGPIQGAPVHRFGIGPHVDSMYLVYGAIVLALVALLIAFVLGKLVDAETKEKKYHRPGSILDRTPGASPGGRLPPSSPSNRRVT